MRKYIESHKNQRPIKDRQIKSQGKYNLNFIDWNNEWERVCEVELMIENGQNVEDKEEEKRVKYHMEKEREKNGVTITKFEKVKPNPLKECYICLKNFSKYKIVRKLPCSHMFCHDCLLPWLKTNYSCPTCKFKLREEVD